MLIKCYTKHVVISINIRIHKYLNFNNFVKKKIVQQ